MAIATFHSFRGEKSALILVQANKFTFTKECVYVPKKACEEMIEGQEFEIPDGFKLVDMIDSDGVVRTTTEGKTLKMLAY